MVKTTAICAVKGGVGKTIVALNLARRLAQRGHRVGLIDCDVDNSNFANFTGTNATIAVDAQKRFIPYEWDGIKVFSMSLIAGREKAVSMTGDRYIQILDDVAESSTWGELDYFVLDLPAGSSDIFRIAMEIFAQSLIGNVVVTQPTVIDATRRVLNLHRYLEIPLIGIVENMSYFKCPDHKTEKVFYIFGEGKTEELAKEFGAELLGKIPLSLEIAKGIEKGNPMLPEDLSTPIYHACDKLEEAEVPKTGFVERLKQVAVEFLKPEVEKVIAALLVTARRELAVSQLRVQKGYTDKRPIMFVITDESDTKEITRVPLRLEENGFVFLKNPKEVDFEIATSFKTLARIIMARKKVGDQTVAFDPVDAWLMNDVKVYGRGYSPRAVEVFRSIFSDEGIMKPIREKYGSVLSRWI